VLTTKPDRLLSTLTSVLSSLADSYVGRDLKAAIPTALAIGSAGLGPAAAAAVGAVATNLTGSTLSFSDLGKQLAGIGTAVIDGAESAVTGLGSGFANIENGIEHAVKKVYGSVENSVSSVVSEVEGAVDAVVNPLTFGLGAVVNALV
jgi:hypothetical protein